MGKHRNTPGTIDRLKKSKRENQMLRTNVSRQKRNLKHLVAVIINARKALQGGDTLRALALLLGDVKYPPSAAKGVGVCPNHSNESYNYIKTCVVCGEEVKK